MGDTRCDARGGLRGWYENLRNDPRLTGWDTEFGAGGDWPGSGSMVRFVREPVFAELLAWPSGCIDTNVFVDGTDAEPRCEHAEVTNDRDLKAFATTFTDRLLSLSASAGRR